MDKTKKEEKHFEPNYNTEQRNKLSQEMHNAITRLANKFRLKETVTKENISLFEEHFPNVKIGAEISRNPDYPRDPKEAFKLFKNYFASIQFEVYKNIFLSEYGALNEVNAKAELSAINEWITEAKTLKYADAIKGKDKYCEYLRLVNGYYENFLINSLDHSETSISAMVYGKYVLLKEWLENFLKGVVSENTTLTLTRKEREYLSERIKGKLPSDINAAKHETISKHLDNARKKNNFESIDELIEAAKQQGI